MMFCRSMRTALGGAALLAISAVTALTSNAKGIEERTLHFFCSKSNCADGERPAAGLIADAAGNLYGTTIEGGKNAMGTVFRLTPEGKETVLYSFCRKANCTDGSYPVAELIMDIAGNLYGTTSAGGTNNTGIVFKLTADGKETVLHSFCAQENCADGSTPYAGLIADSAGNLFGTTVLGGANDGGVVFKLAPDGTEIVLHTFCRTTSCNTGGNPLAGVIADGAGNLYGTTENGGANDFGVVFKLAPDGKETVLYSFCRKENCVDGRSSRAGLIADSAGNLYGTTQQGGANNAGTVFKLTQDGSETVLHSFCSEAQCTDGSTPYPALITDGMGNFYGTTLNGGTGSGTVFKLAPDGTESVLHSFCAKANCGDGYEPVAKLIMDNAGNIYGTAELSGKRFGGTVFKISVSQQ